MTVVPIDVDDIGQAQLHHLLQRTSDIGPVRNEIMNDITVFKRRIFSLKSVFYSRPTMAKIDEYEAIWSNKKIEYDFSSRLAYQNYPTKIVGDGRIKLANRWWLNATILVVLASKIREIQPKFVIEAGSGNGVNLIALAAIFPDIEFTGLELTEAGTSGAIAAAASLEVVRNLVTFVYGAAATTKISFPLQNLKFKQHNLTQPVDSARADLVFTSLALEQMNKVFDEAFPRIISLADQHCLFFEPFLEFNSRSTKNILKTKSYLYRSFYDEIGELGLSGHTYSMPRRINKLKFKFGVCEIV